MSERVRQITGQSISFFERIVLSVEEVTRRPKSPETFLGPEGIAALIANNLKSGIKYIQKINPQENPKGIFKADRKIFNHLQHAVNLPQSGDSHLTLLESVADHIVRLALQYCGPNSRAGNQDTIAQYLMTKLMSIMLASPVADVLAEGLSKSSTTRYPAIWILFKTIQRLHEINPKIVEYYISGPGRHVEEGLNFSLVQDSNSGSWTWVRPEGWRRFAEFSKSLVGLARPTPEYSVASAFSAMSASENKGFLDPKKPLIGILAPLAVRERQAISGLGQDAASVETAHRVAKAVRRKGEDNNPLDLQQHCEVILPDKISAQILDALKYPFVNFGFVPLQLVEVVTELLERYKLGGNIQPLQRMLYGEESQQNPRARSVQDYERYLSQAYYNLARRASLALDQDPDTFCLSIVVIARLLGAMPGDTRDQRIKKKARTEFIKTLALGYARYAQNPGIQPVFDAALQYMYLYWPEADVVSAAQTIMAQALDNENGLLAGFGENGSIFRAISHLAFRGQNTLGSRDNERSLQQKISQSLTSSLLSLQDSNAWKRLQPPRPSEFLADDQSPKTRALKDFFNLGVAFTNADNGNLLLQTARTLAQMAAQEVYSHWTASDPSVLWSFATQLQKQAAGALQDPHSIDHLLRLQQAVSTQVNPLLSQIYAAHDQDHQQTEAVITHAVNLLGTAFNLSAVQINTIRAHLGAIIAGGDIDSSLLDQIAATLAKEGYEGLTTWATMFGAGSLIHGVLSRAGIREAVLSLDRLSEQQMQQVQEVQQILLHAILHHILNKVKTGSEVANNVYRAFTAIQQAQLYAVAQDAQTLATTIRLPPKRRTAHAQALAATYNEMANRQAETYSLVSRLLEFIHQRFPDISVNFGSLLDQELKALGITM